MLVEITNRGHVLTLGFQPVTKHWQLLMSQRPLGEQTTQPECHIYKGATLKEVVREGFHAAL